MNIVFASHAAIGSSFVVGSHHLSRAFSERGHQVAHVSTPVTPAHLSFLRRIDVRGRYRNWLHGGERVDGVLSYVPLAAIPWAFAKHLGTRRNLFLLCIPGIVSTLRGHGFDRVDLLLVDDPRFVGLECSLNARVTVYRATDLYAEMSGDQARSRAEKLLVKRANLLVGTSQPVVDRLASFGQGKPTLLLENGVEFQHFAADSTMPVEYNRIPPPRAVYVGALDARFDGQLLRSVAQANSDASFVLIGPMTRASHELLSTVANVYFLGHRPYKTLPGYLRHATLGLLPTGSHAANAGRSPMKLFEYGAAGLPVVATETAELRRRQLPFVRLAKTHQEFAQRTKELLTDTAESSRLGAVARGLSRERDWRLLAARLLEWCAHNSDSQGSTRWGSERVERAQPVGEGRLVGKC